MGRDLDFIQDEKAQWGKCYTDVAFALSEITPFLDEKDLRKRRYYTKFAVIKEYINLLEEGERKTEGKGFFSFMSSDNTVDNIKNFKGRNLQTLNKFKSCSKCSCLNCVSNCKFKSCTGCRDNAFTKTCDKSKINVSYHEGFFLNLTNNDTGSQNRYKVLATIEDVELENEYIILQNTMNSNDKLVLYYYPGIKNDDFGEITDPEEFDFVVETFQQSDY